MAASPTVMKGFRVLFGIDTFWSSLDNLEAIRQLRLVFKKEEPDHLFAVRSMPSVCNMVITKAWAKRWLGLSASWLVRIQSLTLSMGLKIAADHGGLGKTMARALTQQKKDALVKTARSLKTNEKLKQKEDNKDLFMAILKWRGETKDVPRSFYYGSAQYMKVIRKEQTFEAVTKELKAIYNRHMALVTAREDTKRLLDERLKAAKLPCLGDFYNDCIKAGAGVTDDMVAEIRFRHAIWKNVAYLSIVDGLAANGFYKGIHAHARIVFRRRFAVDGNGRIGAENPLYTTIRQDIELFRGTRNDTDDEDSDSDDDIMIG